MINIASKSDVFGIKNLLNNVWADTYKEILSKELILKATTVWQSLENLESQLESEAGIFIVAKDESEKIIGLATANNIGKGIIYLRRLYVNVENQRQGIGSELLSFVIKYFPKARSLRLDVADGNEKAINFYAKQGFQIVERKEEAIEGETIRIIIMERRLNK